MVLTAEVVAGVLGYVFRQDVSTGSQRFLNLSLKGTATLMISMFYQKELYEPCILIQVSSKSVKTWQVTGIKRIQYGKHLAAILNN